jgi:hypothetical protein
MLIEVLALGGPSLRCGVRHAYSFGGLADGFAVGNAPQQCFAQAAAPVQPGIRCRFRRRLADADQFAVVPPRRDDFAELEGGFVVAAFAAHFAEAIGGARDVEGGIGMSRKESVA